MERALLVTIRFKSQRNTWSIDEIACELEDLVASCGVEIVDNISCVCDKPTPNLLIGKGKTEEIALICQEEKIDVVIFSHDLSGIQQRNLEDIIGKKTIDRTQLILDIFAKHARSPEGKMQVELAQSEYLLPRLIGKGLVLSRLGGGVGTSGPGEQKLEIDRRRIRERIIRLKHELKHLEMHRQTIRKKRKDNSIPQIALVGYTNAGKSTLLNTITKSSQIVSNSLFTTLDPLTKSFTLPNNEKIVISDTVGFLSELPHHLIEAFKATLEEVVYADILIHVLDISQSMAEKRAEAVFKVLDELGAKDKPMITALNKIDLVEDNEYLEKMKKTFANSVCISAKNGKNFDVLFEKITSMFVNHNISKEFKLPLTRMDLVNLLYRQARIEEIKYLQDSIKIKASLPKNVYQNLLNIKEIKWLE
ncbi:MAG: GTPase HflX [Candidatus Omnitrophota bacterium]|jgi:GTP-binding protein HflX|nr:MAG: GTPase HflX [Candidatus Omnitrophota bacterium]